MTAPPQKLQQMLIEGAMRFIEQTRTHWRAGESDKAVETLGRAQAVLTEMLAGLKHEQNPDLAGKVAAIYVFVFRRLIEAGSRRDEQLLDDALNVLQVERETWRQVCEKLAAEGAEAGPGAAAAWPADPPAAAQPGGPPVNPAPALGLSEGQSSGFSLEV